MLCNICIVVALVACFSSLAAPISISSSVPSNMSTPLLDTTTVEATATISPSRTMDAITTAANTTLQQLHTPLFILLDQYRASLARAQYQGLSDTHFFFSDGEGKLTFAWTMMEKALAVADWRTLAAATTVLDGYVEALLSSSMLVDGWIADTEALAHA